MGVACRARRRSPTFEFSSVAGARAFEQLGPIELFSQLLVLQLLVSPEDLLLQDSVCRLEFADLGDHLLGEDRHLLLLVL